MRIGTLVLTVVAFGAGYLAGHDPSDDPDEPPVDTRTTESADPASRSRRGAPAQPATDPTGRRGTVTLSTDAIQAFAERAREAREARPQIQRAWPHTIGRDGDQEWPDRMERLFEQCGGSTDLVATDCSEFPCVATASGEKFESGMIVKLTDMFGEDCPELADDPPDAGHAVVLDYQVDCPDGATETMLMFATGDMGPLVDAYPEATDEDLVQRLMLDLSRRSDELLATWPCDGD